jgi:hypothetical protein
LILMLPLILLAQTDKLPPALFVIFIGSCVLSGHICYT